MRDDDDKDAPVVEARHDREKVHDMTHADNRSVGVFTTVFLCCCVLPAWTAAQAEPVYWIGNTGDWTNPANWNPNPPSEVDDAFINNGGTAQITATGAVCAWLCLGQTSSSIGTVDLSGGDLSAGSVAIGLGGVGAFHQSGGLFTAASTFRLGNDVGSQGTYTLSGDGQLDCSSFLVVGYEGHAQFNQSGGSVTLDSSAPLYVGERPNSEGTYALDDGTLDLADVYVGLYGTGHFVQSGGTHTVLSDLDLGEQAGAIGSYELSGTGQVSAYREVIGRYGIGAFTQSGGTHDVTYSTQIGRYAGSMGTYTISGGALNAARLDVGVEGAATFEISSADPAVHVSQRLRFGPYSSFSAASGATIYMATGADFENRNVDEADMAGLENLNLVFESGMQTGYVEAAGQDKGDVPGGYVDNFAFGTLTVQGWIQLVDAFNNGNRGGPAGHDEAVYVDTLILADGSVLDLNYLNLYYHTLVDEGGVVLNGPGACADDGDCSPDKPFCVDNVCAACRDDGDCGPGLVCLDGRCVRQGLRNPLGPVDSAQRRPVRRDDEMFLAGLSSTNDQTELAIGRNVATADYETTRSGQQVVTGEKGRIIGITPEQAAIVFQDSQNPGDFALEILDLFGDGLPTLAEHPFTPANPASRIDVAVGDLDNVREPYPSLEYHQEVALIYEVENEGTRYALLTVMNFTDVELPCGLVDPKPDPTHTYTRLLSSPLKHQDGVTPNCMAVDVGDFDADGVQDIAAAYVAPSGVVTVEVFTLRTDLFGNTSISAFRAPSSPDCCRPRPDDGGCESSDCEDEVCDESPLCCHDPDEFPFFGGWDEDCAELAWNSNECNCGSPAYMSGFSTGIIADRFELMTAADLDTHPGRIYRDATSWDEADQLAVAGIDFNFGIPLLLMQVWSYDDVAGFTKGLNNAAECWDHSFAGVGILPDSGVRLDLIPFHGWSPIGAHFALVALVDTQRGPVMDLYVFDGKTGSHNGPLYSQDPDWPRNLGLQPETTAPTGANVAVGSFIQFRSRPGDYETILISDPQSPGTSDRPGKLVLLPLDQWAPDYSHMRPIPPFIIPSTGEVIPVGVVPFMDAIDVDGDSGYYRKTNGGATLYLGEPTLFSFTGLQTMDLILGEPPKHIDYLPALGGITNVSQGDAFYTQFASAEQQEETASKETRTDFTTSTSHSYNVSSEASVGLFGIGGSIETSVGQTFEDTHSQSATNYHSETNTITLTQVSRSERDDQLAFKEQIVDLWRYPVMGVVTVDQDDEPLPDDEQPVNPFFDLTIPGPVYNVFGPGKLNDAYQPYHVNGNILSYPVFSAGTFQPPDVGVFEYGGLSGGEFVSEGSSDQPIWAENAFVVGGLAATQTLNFSDAVMNSSTVSVSDRHKTSTDVSVKATVSGSYGIFSGSVSSEYKYHSENEHTFTDTRTASRTNSTSVEIAVNIPSNIPAERGYKFFPAWYVTPGGAYKVTHAVSTTEIGDAPRLFWESTYHTPDPALNMPHRIVADADIYGQTYYRLGTDLSRKKVKGFFIHDLDGKDLFGPPSDGDVVQLDLRVYNLSTTSPVCGLDVRFEAQEYFYGQEIGPRIPIGDATISYIPARGDAPPCPALCSADFDEDGVVDATDLQVFVDMLLNADDCMPKPTCCAGDTNDDGLVNGLDIQNFVEAALSPDWSTEEPETEPGAPENMRYARILWDTSDFGPISGLGLRTWLIYATLDPDNEIPNETHELADRYGDPLRNFTGQPLDPLPGGPSGTYLEKGQNNTGWIAASISAPQEEPPPNCAAAGRERIAVRPSDVYMTQDALAIVDAKSGTETVGAARAYVNETVTLRVALHADEPYLRNGTLWVFDGDPDNGGQLIVNRTVMGVDAASGTFEFFAWQPTRPGRCVLTALFQEAPNDPMPGNARAEIIIDAQPRTTGAR